MKTAIYLDNQYNLCSHIISLDQRIKCNYELKPTGSKYGNLEFYNSFDEFNLPSVPTYAKTSIEFILRYKKMENIQYKFEYGMDGNYISANLLNAEELLKEIDLFYLKMFSKSLEGIPIDFCNLQAIFTDPVAFSESLKLFKELNRDGYGYNNTIHCPTQNYHKILPETGKFLSKLLLRNNLL